MEAKTFILRFDDLWTEFVYDCFFTLEEAKARFIGWRKPRDYWDSNGNHYTGWHKVVSVEDIS